MYKRQDGTYLRCVCSMLSLQSTDIERILADFYLEPKARSDRKWKLKNRICHRQDGSLDSICVAKRTLTERYIRHICDFSRGVLNTRSTRSYPTLAPRPQIRILSFSEGCALDVEEKNGIYY